MCGIYAALPEVEGKAVKRKSKTPERGRSATDDDEDAFQSGKCLFDLKVNTPALDTLPGTTQCRW